MRPTPREPPQHCRQHPTPSAGLLSAITSTGGALAFRRRVCYGNFAAPLIKARIEAHEATTAATVESAAQAIAAAVLEALAAAGQEKNMKEKELEAFVIEPICINTARLSNSIGARFDWGEMRTELFCHLELSQHARAAKE